MKALIILASSLIAFHGLAVEHKVHGVFDLRYSTTDGIDTYLEGDYGKFRFNDGNQFSLAQGGLSYQASWQDKLSLHLIANAYLDGVKDGIGLTEAYIQYKTLPTEQGYRFKARGGLLYPKVSMTNVLTAWASPYTLSYSAINTWLAEELRHQGLDFSLTRLGKFNGSKHDFELSVAAFQANDPAGAVLSWHGWTLSSRQTLRHERQALPNSYIGFVPPESDMFLELDHRIGYHINGQWIWHDHGKVLLGYYDNNADAKVVKNLQWAWTTRFFHFGVKWQLGHGLDLIAQHLSGDTLMLSTSGMVDLVNNDYDSSFLLLTKKQGKHRFTGRIEQFEVADRDTFSFDNNNEKGDALTLNYSYRINRHWFLHLEANWVDSDRPSRVSKGQPESLIERQLQLAARYFF